MSKRKRAREDRVDWVRCWPFLALHLGCLGAFFTGVTTAAIVTAVVLYVVRMFAITGFYHRYFSHRTFRASRAVQFAMALIGTTAVQRGPLWWSAHHRHHHAVSDREDDLHSPRQQGFWRSHVGWFMTPAAYRTDERRVGDWAKYPELRFLDRHDWIGPVALATILFLAGGWTMLVWGFCVSTVVLYHATYTINSLAHRIGSRRYETGDDSRNNFVLALLTLGEGWHNNHHRYAASARQGFFWWEIDLTYYGLRLLALLGLIRDLRPVPARVLAEAPGRRLRKELP